MFRQNPNLIQTPLTPISTSRTPLFLLHDGGGTIFSYYCLSDLHRPVYGLFNPCYSSKSTFEGGIPEMAKTYLRYIIDTLYGDDQCNGKVSAAKGGNPKEGERDLILGGWSLGGMVSVELSRQILDFNTGEAAKAQAAGKPKENARKLNVLGIVMIDSMNPNQQHFPQDAKIASPNATTMQWGPHTKPETKEAVLRCFHEARRMLSFWEMPTWPRLEEQEALSERETGGPPPVVLLKAKENVPLQEEQAKEGEVSRTDVQRKDATLGWGKYHEGMVRKVIEVEGNHFNLFTEEKRAEIVTRGVREGCELLEGLWKQRA